MQYVATILSHVWKFEKWASVCGVCIKFNVPLDNLRLLRGTVGY